MEELLIVLETVAIETPARRATSWIFMADTPLGSYTPFGRHKTRHNAKQLKKFVRPIDLSRVSRLTSTANVFIPALDGAG